jgi:hypothetical protein
MSEIHFQPVTAFRNVGLYKGRLYKKSKKATQQHLDTVINNPEFIQASDKLMVDSVRGFFNSIKKPIASYLTKMPKGMNPVDVWTNNHSGNAVLEESIRNTIFGSHNESSVPMDLTQRYRNMAQYLFNNHSPFGGVQGADGYSAEEKNDRIWLDINKRFTNSGSPIINPDGTTTVDCYITPNGYLQGVYPSAFGCEVHLCSVLIDSSEGGMSIGVSNPRVVEITPSRMSQVVVGTNTSVVYDAVIGESSEAITAFVFYRVRCYTVTEKGAKKYYSSNDGADSILMRY